MHKVGLQKFKLSFIQAFSLHLGIIALFAISIFSTATVKTPKKPIPEIIQASILDESKIQEEAKRQKQQEVDKLQAEQKRKQLLEEQLQQEQQRINKLKEQSIAEERKAREKAEQRKQEEAREEKRLADIKQQAEAAERQAKLKEQERKAAQEKARQEEQKRKQAEAKAKADKERKEEAAAKARAAEKKQEAERQAALKRKKAAEAEQAAKAARQQVEQARIKATQDQVAMVTASNAIMRKVQNRWIRPSTSKTGLQCTIQVKLLSSGEVMQAVVIKSSGDAIFDRSAENAVRKASPLPVPADRDLFNREFNSFTFVFKPQ
jgi:colicin import membrane protein